MNTLATHPVGSIPIAERAAIEQLLGKTLEDDQQLLVMAFDPSLPADPAQRAATRERLVREFASRSREADERGITSEMADAAVEEAMQHIRPRSR